MKTIMYYPFESKNNKYIEISKNAISQCDINIIPFEGNIKNTAALTSTSAAIFNWLESLNYEKTFGKQLYQLVINIFKIEILKLYGIKIITTFHNKRNHDSEKVGIDLHFLFMKWLFRRADAIIILSIDSQKYLNDFLPESKWIDKIWYIPHPNYIGAYSPSISEVAYPNNSKMQILFIGLLKKYKNIELIIECAKKTQNLDVEYVIAGGCSEDFKRELESLVLKLKNVKLEFGFVSDNVVDRKIREADILVLPYNTESSMNSGTVYLAFSNGRTVICPEISTVKEFNQNDVYGYRYRNREEHLMKLENTIRLAYNDWKNNRQEFECKGKRVFEAVKNQSSQNEILSRYQSMFDVLINNKN